MRSVLILGFPRGHARLRRVEADLPRLAELNRVLVLSPHDASLRCEVGLIFMRKGLKDEGLG
jgi:hypothetical protein